MSVSANFIPPPVGTRYGVVYVKADGSLSPDDLPIVRSGNMYTLQGNLTNFGFKIERYGVTLDGAGFAVVATDWYAPRTAVVLESCNNVTVKNILIVNFDTAILVNASSSNRVEGNRVLNSVNGISVVSGSSGNVFTSNFLEGSSFHGYGIYIADSPSNTFRNNSVSNGERTFFWTSTNKFNFGVKVNKDTPSSNLVQDIDASNLLDGKPMIYWVNQQDKAIPAADASYVALVNCRNITVQNLYLQNNEQGVLLADTTESTISGCNITGNNVGLTLLRSTNNTIKNNDVGKNIYGVTFYSSGNTLTYNRFKDNEREQIDFQEGYLNSIDLSNTVNSTPLYYALNQQDKTVPAEAGYVFLFNCTRMIIQNLTIKNQTRGLRLVSTSDSLVINNEVVDNEYGIYLRDCVNNKIVKNSFTGNSQSSIYLKFSDNNIVSENQITNGFVGLCVENCTGNNFSRNTITCNYTGVEFSGSSNNQLLENRIEGNGRAGIILTYLSNNNLIAGNNVTDNGFVTVDLNNAQGNTFTCNNFKITIEIRNGFYLAHQILDIYANVLVTSPFMVPSHNIWDKDRQGNYWSDYKGIDANGDGVGDTAHMVDTSPHAEPIVVNGKNYTVEATPDIDRHPLAAPYSFPSEPQLKVLEPSNNCYNVDNIPLTFTVADTNLKAKYSLDQHEEIEANANTTLNDVSDGAHSLLMWTIDHKWGTPANFQIINFNINKENATMPTQTIKPIEEETKPQTQGDDPQWMLGVACLTVIVVIIMIIRFAKR
ncbi:MAG: right-handed parallel beta-helix repeat-containing protein [Candidatus Bathyarchaeota archaeon]|nr:right-handed parallel beta-helix repeat-containing protein [Candidatus Bathyarchaeota archaeon]